MRLLLLIFVCQGVVDSFCKYNSKEKRVSLTHWFCTTAAFLQEPATTHAFVNRTSSFQCICEGCLGQFWEINGINAEFKPNKDEGATEEGPIVSGSSFKYILTLPATVFFNNSNITCRIYKGIGINDIKTSETAKLYLQGISIYCDQLCHVYDQPASICLICMNHTAMYIIH